jgi:hypothetical protein
MPDPFPDPPLTDLTWTTIVPGHRLIYLGHNVDRPFATALTMDWEPGSGHSRLWRTTPPSAGVDPLDDLRAERTFATINGDIQVVYVAQTSDVNGNLTTPLVMGFRPSTKNVRLWQLDRGLAESTGNVDSLVPKLNDSTFFTIGPGHELIYLDHDAVLDWEPATAGGHARVWLLDRNRTNPFPAHSTADPLPIKLADHTFSTITSTHQLVYLTGDTVLDRDRVSGLLRVWSYDRTVSTGDFLPTELHEANVPGRFAQDEQLVYIARDLVLAFAPSFGPPPSGRARVFEYDRVPTEDPLQLALDDVSTRALPWVSAARAAVGVPGTSPPTGTVDTLLRQHFRYDTASIGQVAALEQIRDTLEKVETALSSMAHVR